MSYLVKEIFYTLQGEGAHAGRPAVFCRFTGCNLWTGREEHRAIAICQFCDTDFVGTDGPGGGTFATADRPRRRGRATRGRATPLSDRFVVCTGGEPLLAARRRTLVARSMHAGFEVAIETNGTLPPPPGIDWICVSPKAGADLVLAAGDELKLVFPQAGARPERRSRTSTSTTSSCSRWTAPTATRTPQLAVAYCLGHPRWRLSLQTHKYLGIP